jgi:predicted RNase H-related nuclease YkuK (DUF458 family)
MQEKMFKSITHGKLTKQQVFEQILKDLTFDLDQEYVLSIGTDSQTYSGMKIVTVIAVHKVGKGGKFFYYEEYLPRPNSIREKLYEETQRSLELGKQLTEFLYQNELDFEIMIHVDMGNSKKGKTYELINEIMGWITAEGFVGVYKPDSNTASEIADRLSK